MDQNESIFLGADCLSKKMTFQCFLEQLDRLRLVWAYLRQQAGERASIGFENQQKLSTDHHLHLHPQPPVRKKTFSFIINPRFPFVLFFIVLK